MIRLLTFLTFLSTIAVMNSEIQRRITSMYDSKEGMRKTYQNLMKTSRKGNNQTESLRLPTVITQYSWVNDAWDTENAISEKYTYNENGSVVTLMSGNRLIEYSYDELGRESGYTEFELYDGEEYQSSEVEYRYDSIVTDFITAALVKYGDSDTASGYGTEIIRNEDENIIKIVSYFENDGEKSYDGEWVSIEYGQDGKATSIAKKSGYFGEEGMIEIITDWQLTDIVWENTDGQILFKYIDLEYPLSEWYFGKNRIKSAVLIDYPWPDPVYVTVEYDEESYHSRFVMNGELIGEIIYQSLDNIRSYHYESHMQMSTYDLEGNLLPTVTDNTSTLLTDRFGLTLEFEDESIRHRESEEQDIVKYHYKGYLTYDSYGYPIEALGTEYSEEADEFVNTDLVIFSDYVDCSADVQSMESNMDEKPEYFNLQGVKIDNPSKGIYIRRQGSSFEKIAF